MTAKRWDRFALGVIVALVLAVVAVLIGILGFVLAAGLPHLTWHFLSGTALAFAAGGGIRDQLFNSAYLLVLTMVLSLPVALGAGIYLSEYAPANAITAVVRTAIEVLSSLPSVVVGLFGYLLFVIQFGMGFSILAGAIALTFFNLPLHTRSVEDALTAVPELQRAGGAALGLSDWRTITGIVLPAALPGILTGVILSAGRVFGEAAALIYTAGQSAPSVNYANWNPLAADSFLNPLRPAETLAVHIWKVNTEAVTPDAAAISAGASAVLVLAVLGFNLLARWGGQRLYRHLTGE